jgi:hypothetical protein
MAREVAGVGGKEQIKERLDLLLVAAKAKIRGYRDEINEQFLNPAMIDKIQIPGIRAIRFIEQYHVASSSGFNQQVGDHMTQAIDAFFSIGGKDQDTKKAIQGGVKALISTALDAFIGSTEAGESEERIYVVIPENNAFVRADIAVWKYHMSEKALGDNEDSAVAYVLCKSVIDHTKLTLDELIYLVSQTLTERPVKRYADLPASDTDPTIRKRVRLDFNGQPMLIDPKGGNKPENWQLWLLGDQETEGGTPPTISEVEAYIEELIRVWKKLKEDRGS